MSKVLRVFSARGVCGFIERQGFLWNSLQNSVLGASVRFTEKSLGEYKLLIKKQIAYRSEVF